MTTHPNRKPVTPADVDRALADTARIARPTARERAEQVMQNAKAELNGATEALIAREPGAAERADEALAQVNRARVELAAFDLPTITTTENSK